MRGLGPRRAAVLALAVHGLWIAAYFAVGHEARDFIKIGPRFVARSHASRVIKLDPTYRYPANRAGISGTGYDGQFPYYMALDFKHARYYMDGPAYRYSRVLYPVTARVLAGGDAGLIPYTLILINCLAIGGGTLALAAWLRRRRAPPALALAFGLFPGLLLGLQRDLTEPLAYALVAGGVWAWDLRGARRLLVAGALFGLAGLARQTASVFAVVFAAGLLLEGQGPWRERVRAGAGRAAGFAALAIGPIVAYTVAISLWLHSVGTSNLFEPVPLLGLFASPSLTEQSPLLVLGVQIAFVVVPSLIAAGVAWRGTPARDSGAAVARACVVVNVLLFVVFLSREVYVSYTASSRNVSGVVLAGVMCAAYATGRSPRSARLLRAAFALWLVMLPVIAVYGFSEGRV